MGVGMKLVLAAISVALCAASSAAIVAETITYTYDAKGRLIRVEHAGSLNSGVRVALTHDAADNRRNVKISGSSR